MRGRAGKAYLNVNLHARQAAGGVVAEFEDLVEPGDEEHAPRTGVDPAESELAGGRTVEDLSQLQQFRDVGGVEEVDAGKIENDVASALALFDELLNGIQIIRKDRVILQLGKDDVVGPVFD